MKKIYSLMFAMGAICAASLTSCSSDSLDAEYVAVKESRSGNWSFYSPDGKMVCKDEFKSEPSAVINGYFYVKEGEKGLYTLYKVGEKPEAVKGCEGLYSVGYMSEGIVPVVKKDARITFVDKNGEVKFTLEPIGGKEIVAASAYATEGMIAVLNADGKCGYVNTKGETVIEPKYADATSFVDGMAIVREKGKDDYTLGAYLVIDKKGEQVFKLKDGYTPADAFKDGYLLCKDANGQALLLDKKGEQAFKFKDGVSVKDYNSKYVLYRDLDGSGVMTLEGEVKIKPGKYTSFDFVDESKFIADKDEKTVILNADGEETKVFDGTVRYDKNFGYRMIGSNTTTFIDEDGKEKKDATFFYIGDFGVRKSVVYSSFKSKKDEAAAAPVAPSYSDYSEPDATTEVVEEAAEEVTY